MQKNDKNYEFIDLIASFSRIEMRDFYRFVQSKYFNTDETLVVLTAFLKDNFFVKEEKQFDNKVQRKVFNLLFPAMKSKGKLTSNEQLKLNNKFSLLTKLGLKFLLVESIEEDHSSKSKLLYQQLTDRKLSRLLEKNQKKDRKILDEQKEKDINFYLKKYHIERGKCYYQFKHDVNNFIKNDNLTELMQAFDVYYLSNRILHELAGISLMGVSRKSYDFAPIKYISELSKLPQYSQVPVLSVCFTAYNMELSRLHFMQSKKTRQQTEHLNEQSEEYFHHLVNLLYQHSDELSHDLKIDFYTSAVNFCIHQIKLKNLDYYQQAFELYQLIEHKGLLTVGDKIRLGKLNLIITIACRTQQFEWAKTILNKYKNKIEAPDNEGIYHFNLGQIAFHQKDYALADDYFFKVEQAEVQHTYFVSCKVLRLKCLYELENLDYDATQRVFKSAKEFVRGNKLLSDVDRTGQINFINTLIHIHKIKYRLKIERKQKIIQELDKVKLKIEAFDVISDAHWLLEKIGDIEE